MTSATSGSTFGWTSSRSNPGPPVTSIVSSSGPRFGWSMPICARIASEVYLSFQPTRRDPRDNRPAVRADWTR
jgi:hypothetical protein